MRKEKLLKKLPIIIIIVLLIVAAVVFLILNNKPKKKVKEEPKTTEPVIEKKLQIVDINSKTRPYAIMINNLGTARPLQSGLQDAMIIYEIIVEGGITRYMAVFQDQKTERIGSIRSARHYFLDYALENDAIYVHHGQSPQANSDISSLKIDRIVVSESKTGWRDKSLRKQGYATEHTLFTNIEKLNSGLGSKRTERNKDFLLNYSIDSLDLSGKENAKVASNISIKYSNTITSSYTYDAENKVYKRFVNNKEHKDYVTGNQYTFKNIITYKVKNHKISSSDKKGRQDIENIGTGEGYYISEGYAVPITWEKKSRSSQTIYKFKDGTELQVNDGNTFIQIQPTGMELSIS